MYPLTGGLIIGLAVSLMLLFNGRVTGISGIVYGLFKPSFSDFGWRFSFLVGLIVGGVILTFFLPASFSGQLPIQNSTVAIAGLLVGFGTVLGSGCTSGHGVCGISRFSMRSLVATLVFIMSGILFVALFKNWGSFL